MAITLMEAKVGMADKVDQQIIDMFRRSSALLDKMTFDNVISPGTGGSTLTCRTYSGSTQIGDAQTCTFRATAAKVVCAPTVSGTVEDSNEATIALTGDKSALVRYMSTALCTITAQAKNSATLTGKAVGGAAVTGTTRTIEEIESSSVVFTATDSRGYSTSAAVPVSLVPYIRLTCNPVIRRTDPTSGNAQLTIKGNYYNGSFGAADNQLAVSYTLGGEEFTVEVTPEGNSYEMTVALEGLDYQSSHTITVRVEDALDSVEKTLTLGKGVPVFDWGENDFSFHVPVTGDFCGTFQGAYIRTVRLSANDTITVQSKMNAFASGSTERQSLFLFGSANGVLISGVAGLRGTGDGGWNGTGEVAVTARSSGQFAITLPTKAYDWFTLISAEPFSIIA